jgi:hypothetical protein
MKRTFVKGRSFSNGSFLFAPPEIPGAGSSSFLNSSILLSVHGARTGLTAFLRYFFAQGCKLNHRHLYLAMIALI